MKALLVEDSATCITEGRRILEALGYRVTCRTAASSARGTIGARGPFDMYIIDANIPENLYGKPGDGLLLVRWIRFNDPSARVIVWSADKSVEDRARVLGAAFAWKEDREALARAVRGA